MEEIQKKSSAGAAASVMLAAVLWGAIGLWSRNLMAGGLSPTGIVVVRNFGGMLLLLGTVFSIKDRSVFRVKREHLKYFFGTGIISVLLFTICYFKCQKVCSLAVSSILLYTAPSFVVVLSAILWKEPITKRKVAALAVTLVGCAAVCGLFSGDVSVTVTGFLLGLGSGFFYSLYSIFGRYALANYSPMTVTVWTFLFAGPASLVLLRPADMRIMADPAMVLWGLGLVVFSSVLPYIFYTLGLSRMEAGRASILASLEPVAAAIIGVAVFGEPMSVMTLVGIALVLSGVYILR